MPRTITIITYASVLALSSGVARGQWRTDVFAVAKSSGGVTSAGTTAFFAGGRDLNSFSAYLDQVESYDSATGTWTAAPLSEARDSLSAAATGGFAVFAGGIPSPGGVSDVVDVLDLSTGAWSRTKLPIAAHHMGAVGVGGLFYFAGGGASSDHLKVVQIFDPRSGLWSVEPLEGPKRFNIATATDGRRAFFVAGDPKPKGSTIVNVFDSLTDTWSTTGLPNIRQFGHGCEVLDGRLYVFGGWRAPEVVDVYDIETEAWSSLAIPGPVSAGAACTVGPYLLIGVESVGGGDLQDGAWLFHPATGRWREYTLSAKAAGRFVTSAGDHVGIIAGGQVAGGGSTDVVDILEVGPVGSSYCGPAESNSTGAHAKLSAFGSPVASEDLVTFTARDLPPGEIGILLASRSQAFVPFAGGGQGTLCIGHEIARFTSDVRAADANGEIVLDPVLSAVPMSPAVAAQSGETWNFQLWYWDANPDPTSNFTDGRVIAFR